MNNHVLYGKLLIELLALLFNVPEFAWITAVFCVVAKAEVTLTRIPAGVAEGGGRNADRAECRKAECRQLLPDFGRNAETGGIRNESVFEAKNQVTTEY